MTGTQAAGLQQLAAGRAGAPGTSLSPRGLCSTETGVREPGRRCSALRTGAQKSLRKLRQSQKSASGRKEETETPPLDGGRVSPDTVYGTRNIVVVMFSK